MVYNLRETFCREQHKKSGVTIYVINELNVSTACIDATKLSIEMVYELDALKKANYYIIGLYRPSENRFEEAQDPLCKLLDTIPSGTVQLGDKTIPHSNNNQNKVEDLLNAYNTIRHDIPVSRLTPTSQTSIDMVCSNQH